MVPRLSWNRHQNQRRFCAGAVGVRQNKVGRPGSARGNTLKIGDLVQDQSRAVRKHRPWVGIIIAVGNRPYSSRAPEHQEVQVHFLGHNVSRWMLTRQLEVLSEAR